MPAECRSAARRIEEQEHALRAFAAAQHHHRSGMGIALGKCKAEGLIVRQRPGEDRLGPQLVEHLLFGEGQLGRRDNGVVVVTDRREAHSRAAHLRDDDELRASDSEHLGDAVEELAGALAHLPG